MSGSFKALIVEQHDGKAIAAFKLLPLAALPAGDVLISVAYSSLNYKDALAVTGKGKIIRRYPMVPGIDLAGTVEESKSPSFKRGDHVLATGCGLGEETWGGYAQKARVSCGSVVPLPKGLDSKRAMAIGTAGFTAMLCVMALEDHGLAPDRGDVLVTGAAGGVGSIAVAVLSKRGYSVAASTGRKECHAYLKSLGAAKMVDRESLARNSEKGLEAERWQGAVDTVGGSTLATVFKQLRYNGSVAACGLAGGAELHATVYPFILRGINLLGINSSLCPMDRRKKSWQRLARELPLDLLDSMTNLAGLKDVPRLSEEILAGKIRGRTVIDLNS